MSLLADEKAPIPDPASVGLLDAFPVVVCLFVCFLFSFSGEIAPSRGLPKTSTLKPTGFSLWLSPFPPPPPRILGFTWAGLSERPGSLLPSVGRTGVGGAPSYPGSRGLPSFLPQVLLSEGPSPACPVSYFRESERQGLESSFSFSSALEAHRRQRLSGEATLQFHKLLPYPSFHSCLGASPCYHPEGDRALGSVRTGLVASLSRI